MMPHDEQEVSMQYIFMLYVQEDGWKKLTPEQQTEGVAAYEAYVNALSEAGVFRGTNRLQSTATATTLRVVDGKAQVLDGPYADTKEQIGGYFIVDVPDLDAAIGWASRCPTVDHGVVEVRPLWAAEESR